MTHHTMTGVDHMDSMNYRGFFRILTDILSDRVDRTPDDADNHRGTPDRFKKRMSQIVNPVLGVVNGIREELDFGVFNG